MRPLAAVLFLGLTWLIGGGAAGAPLKLATWDVDWLTERAAGDPGLPPDLHPRSAEDIALLRRYAEALDADVIALQGVDTEAAAARLFPPDRYALHLTGDPVLLHAGFAVRRGIAFTANPDVAALAADPDGGHHLRSGADITLDWGGAKLRLLAVHLKAGCRDSKLNAPDRPACGVLNAQLAALQQWVAARATEQAAFVVLGNFNRRMDGRDPFLAGLARTAPVTRLTEGRSNPCWGGTDFVDHVLAFGAAREWASPASLKVMAYRETGDEWKPRLASHCPVSVRFEAPE